MVTDATPTLDIAPTPGATEGTLAMNAVRFRIPGDTIQKAVHQLPDDQRTALLWFAGYCRSQNFGRDEMSTLLRKPNGDYYSYDSIYQTLTGRRMEAGSGLDNMVKAINSLRKIAEERLAQVESGFIKTRLSEMIWKRCRRALLRRRIGYIFGDSQIGKTWALKEYQRLNNHGETIYVEVPETGSLGLFLAELAVALGIPPQQKTAELRRRLLESFDDRMLLIVDEAHRCFGSREGRSGLAIFGFLRELWNKRQCGIMISMTNEGRDSLLKGPNKKTLEQIWRRRLQPLQLPAIPFADDLDKFAESYGLPPATDTTVKVVIGTKHHADTPLRIQTAVIETDGLGMWVSILQDASDDAREQKRPITWGAVLKAYCLSLAEAEEAQ